MLNQQPVIQEKPNAVDLDFRGGEIELRDVAFKHLLSGPQGKGEEVKKEELAVKPKKQSEFLFKGLSLKIKPGTSNAIVGHSGFGKTTMINMIVSLVAN